MNEENNFKTKIVVVDDNNLIKQTILNYCNLHSDLEVIGCASDGREALRLIRNLEPDIVLMDVIIPYLDGIEVLEQLNKSEKRPKCIMISAVGQEKVIQKAMKMGAEYYVVKPFEMELLVKRIRECIGNIKKQRKENLNLNEGEERKTINVNSKKVEEFISELLHDLGIPMHMKGFRFIKDAVLTILKNPETLEQVTKVLYPKIAKKFKTISSRVERAIRHAIEISWDKGDCELREEVFGYSILEDNKKPTNSEYIAIIAEKVRFDLGIE